MPYNVLIVQSDPKAARTLSRLFGERGNRAWETSDARQAFLLIEQYRPDLLVLDLHLPGDGWLILLTQIRELYPTIKVIITNKFPVLQREMLAKEKGARVFLREPFNRRWLEKALESLEEKTTPLPRAAARAAETAAPGKAQAVEPAPATPKVRFPVRLKITLPYFLLALAFALAGAFVVSQVVLESIEDRFTNELAGKARTAADLMVQEENRLLETLRLVANSQGVAEAITAGDAETLRAIAYPVAVNYQEDALEIVDTQGRSLLSLVHTPGGQIEDYQASRGGDTFAGVDFVQHTLRQAVDAEGDKFAGLVHPADGQYFFVAGPVRAADGTLVGAVLVGRQLDTLVRRLRQSGDVEITLYAVDGSPAASTLIATGSAEYNLSQAQVTEILARQDTASLVREVNAAQVLYGEMLGAWEARNGADLGVMGVSLAKLFLVRTSQITRTQVFLIVLIAFLLVVAVGITLADQITRPLLRVVSASAEVARGNLSVKVEPRGNDEVAVLAHSFNSMVAELQEGSIYRDLLGRTVSPEVREQLRSTFRAGDLRLEGQEAIATVLMTDIRSFTTITERAGPTTVLNWLNEYFGEIVPIITAHGGVVNKFEGDSMLAFFGILPALLEPKESAYAAAQAAVEILKAIEALNVRRVERGETPLTTGIGVHTGMVTAGGLGAADRLHYTIIGDTVNTTQRIETLTRQLFNTTGALLSHATVSALAEKRVEFYLTPMGAHRVKGKEENILIYRLWSAPPTTGEFMR